MSAAPGGGVRAILARRGLRLSRERGQNFLTDESLADRLAGLAGVGADDRVIEIGTGLGVLTRALARRARHVVSIEIDSGLVAALHEESLRVRHYLHPSTESKILRVSETELLQRHETTLIGKEGSGCRSLLRDDKKVTN